MTVYNVYVYSLNHGLHITIIRIISYVNLQVEFEDYEFDQKISQNYLIMQAACREIESSMGNFERQGSDTPEPENQQLNCKLV